MTKKLTAFLAAITMTLCIGAGILLIGAGAYWNKNGSTAKDTANQPAMVAANESQQVEIAQLQTLVDQYKQRDQQYQQREQQYQQQLSSATAQLQQDQQQFQQVNLLLGTLQQRGVIALTNDGQIVINR